MALTPMMKQYFEMKTQYEDAILFFRLGDFYEMFYDDAYKASRLLGLTLTSRGTDEKGQKIPMCGIPYHAANNYIPKLLAHNIKIAICEQTEEASVGKGLTKRAVVDVISPGMISEDNLIQPDKNNYLLAVATDEKGHYTVAYTDISTGEFFFTQLNSKDDLAEEIQKINPSEVINGARLDLNSIAQCFVSVFSPPSLQESEEIIKNKFSIFSLEILGLNENSPALISIATIIKYLDANKKMTKSLVIPKMYDSADYLYINSNTLKNLEIITPLFSENKSGSLLWVLDLTKTPMGSRLLKKWCQRPLVDVQKINERLNLVEYFYNNPLSLKKITEYFGKIYDLERLNSKLINNLINPKDLIALSSSLSYMPQIHELLEDIPAELSGLVTIPYQYLEDLLQIVNLVMLAIVDEPVVQINQGGFIRSNYSPELDTLRNEVANSKQWMIDFENKLKRETGIKSLKINYNRVFGYYIEVTTSNLANVPAYFIRRQTLANCERFYTEELKEKENFILHADELIIRKEIELFEEVIRQIQQYVNIISALAHKLANLDVISALATVATNNNYKKPVFNKDGLIEMKNSRHPIVEKNSKLSQYVANNVYFSPQQVSFIILTGPNMAGKSTYMRQIALILVMAQIGSFVPADFANISLVDKLFARIGANDNLFEGKSTFMVEMLETASILHNATANSFIILDEIGRGTSTFDGLSIAASVAKYIYSNIKAKTIFATHYHEITTLAHRNPLMKNMNVSIFENDTGIRFTYKVIPGKAEKSYGIHVAELAGLPLDVLQDARKILESLEEEQLSLNKLKKPKSIQEPLF